MNQNEKALDLVRSFYEVYPVNGNEYGMEWGMAKQCALIAVDEIINALGDNSFYMQGETNIDEIIDYWKQIRLKVENQ